MCDHRRHHQNLEAGAGGGFVEDLYPRLNVLYFQFPNSRGAVKTFREARGRSTRAMRGTGRRAKATSNIRQVTANCLARRRRRQLEND